jgi:hypothetical protein
MLRCAIHTNVMPEAGTGGLFDDFLTWNVRVSPMRALVALAMLLMTLSAAVQAKPAPLNVRPVALSTNDTVIDTGPASSKLEADYFRAPQPPYAAGRVFPCRLDLHLFDKTRIAQSCR